MDFGTQLGRQNPSKFDVKMHEKMSKVEERLECNFNRFQRFLVGGWGGHTWRLGSGGLITLKVVRKYKRKEVGVVKL